MKQTDFVVREHETFKLRVIVRDNQGRDNLKSLYFVREHIEDGEIVSTSAYEFFLTAEELQLLSNKLQAISHE